MKASEAKTHNKKSNRVYALIAAVIMVLSVIALSACEKKETEVPQPPKDCIITVVGGSGGVTVKEGESVTVTANPPPADMVFDGWKIGDDIVSASESYTFIASESVTITATYKSTYSIWDGTYYQVNDENVPEGYVLDTVNGKVHIKSAAGLAYFASQVYSNESGQQTMFWNYEISIEADIDLNNYDWKPMDAEKNVFNGVTINGNNHTIKNMYAMVQPVSKTVSEYRGWSCGGFITMVGGATKLVIKDLTFKNATVVGGGQAGVVIGGLYNATVALNNVNVISSLVNGGSGTRIGGLIGRMGNSTMGGGRENVLIKNCSVVDTKLAGQHSIGGLVGMDAQDTLYFKKIITKALFGNLKTYEDIAAKAEKGDAINIKYKAEIDGCVTREGLINTIEKFKAAKDSRAKTLEAMQTANPNWGISYENNVVKNCKIIAYGVNANIATRNVYFGGGESAANIIINNIGENDSTNKLFYTNAYVQQVPKIYPLFPTRAASLTEFFQSYADGNEAADSNDIRKIYIAGDLDFTQVFKQNAQLWEGIDIVLNEGVTFYLVDGATITGIPASVTAKCTVTALECEAVSPN